MNSYGLLSVRDLIKHYPSRPTAFGRIRGVVHAVDGVSFELRQGESLGLVGESGSGKTTLLRTIVRLEQPTAGQIRFDSEDWLALRGEKLRRRRRDLQIVFQDPYTSLNPRMTVGDQIIEPLRVQKLVEKKRLPERLEELLSEVGLDPKMASCYPHEFSGGQRQRIGIARALATRPKLLACDEPVAALDVSVGAQIVNLLLDLRRRRGLSYLFVAHDLAVVSRIADRIAVMYLGQIVEEGKAEDVLLRPLHPYTVALLSAVPRIPEAEGPGSKIDDGTEASVRRAVPGGERPRGQSAIRNAPSAIARIVLPGEPPSPVNIPAGCRFHPRCPIARPRCAGEIPALEQIEPERHVACFFPGELRQGRPSEPKNSKAG